jgi:hypothetical protein
MLVSLFSAVCAALGARLARAERRLRAKKHSPRRAKSVEKSSDCYCMNKFVESKKTSMFVLQFLALAQLHGRR